MTDDSLDTYDETEWRDVTKRLRPDWDDADFDRAWAEFMKLKRAKALQ